MNAGTEKLLCGAVALLLLLAIVATQSTDDDDDDDSVPSPLVELDESNWQDILEGEWLVKL